MVPGTDETDYYHGRVTQAVPEQHAAVTEAGDVA